MGAKEDTFSVPGFLANGIYAGIKAEGKRDLSLIYSAVPAQAVGMFTTNSFKAAPVLIDMKRIKSRVAQAIVINSGNANAASGKEGYRDALAVSKAVAKGLKIKEEHVLVASTGIIGQRLPVDKIKGGVKDLIGGLRKEGFGDAEEGMLTTDRFAKVAYRKEKIDGQEIKLCGLAKGAGMISPQMATMLAFFMTDIAAEFSALQSAFRQAVQESFNAITVDGCMSTNDTVIMLANGVGLNQKIKMGTKAYFIFKEMLCSAMSELAAAIVRDGEGATKVIAVTIRQAKSTADAKKAAYAVANSNLVKTAFFGGDPNWGRIIAAVGAAGITFSVPSVTVFFEEVPIYRHGRAIGENEKRLVEIMAQAQIKLTVDLGSGRKSFTVLASDLGYDYIKINAHYHT